MGDHDSYLELIGRINGVIGKINSLRVDLSELPPRDRTSLARLMQSVASEALGEGEADHDHQEPNPADSGDKDQQEEDGNVRNRMLKYLIARADYKMPATVIEIANSVKATTGSVTTILYKRNYGQFSRAEKTSPGKTRWQITDKGRADYMETVEGKPVRLSEQVDEDLNDDDAEADFQEEAALFRLK